MCVTDHSTIFFRYRIRRAALCCLSHSVSHKYQPRRQYEATHFRVLPIWMRYDVDVHHPVRVTSQAPESCLLGDATFAWFISFWHYSSGYSSSIVTIFIAFNGTIVGTAKGTKGTKVTPGSTNIELVRLAKQPNKHL